MKRAGAPFSTALSVIGAGDNRHVDQNWHGDYSYVATDKNAIAVAECY